MWTEHEDEWLFNPHYITRFWKQTDQSKIDRTNPIMILQTQCRAINDQGNMWTDLRWFVNHAELSSCCHIEVYGRYLSLDYIRTRESTTDP